MAIAIDVRLDAGELDREHLPGAPHARLHFVGDQQDAVLRRQLAQPLQELVRRDDVAAFALNRLDDDRRDFVGRDEMREQLVLDEVDARGRAALGRRAERAAVAVRDTARDRRRAAAGRTRGAGSPCSPSATAIPCVRP